MEVLAPLDHRQFSSHSDWYSHHKYRGGLATPKSPEALDRSAMKTNEPLFRPEGERATPSYDSPLPAPGSRQSPRHLHTLPPISSTKPSLPPIRSLLAEPLASPPTTPTSSRRTIQGLHHGQESEYTHQHKRSCSNFAWDRRSSHASPASAHSMSLPSLEGSLRRDSATNSAPESAIYRQPEDPYSRHRLSNAFLPELRSAAFEPRPSSPDRAPRSSDIIFSRKRSYDSMAVPSASERERLPPPSAWSLNGQAPHSLMTRPSYHPASPPAPHFRSYSTSGAPLARPNMVDGHAIMPHGHALGEASSPPSSMYSRPTVYDYQLSKARKRSNLPKESTDIMKRWFEDHLDNPYPSEEEKKYFAAKAGINLTQVCGAHRLVGFSHGSLTGSHRLAIGSSTTGDDAPS
ncbi:hypothetical protein ANO11243_006950 [Dothideomycetidae sp. 11243]|nr:hypothetical protein ANO11243_006950 [fungal sp. No.11243]